jgi:hypothetical protein
VAAGTIPPKPPVDPANPGQFNKTALAAAISQRLVGSGAGSGITTPAAAQKAVIWVDRGDEVLIHLDSVRVKIADRLLLISVDLETDQTGRTPLIAAFALGDDNDPAGLIAVTDDLPRGNEVLASRWGKILQEALWASVLAIVTDYAQAARGVAIGISAKADSLQLHVGTTPIHIPGNVGGVLK